MCVVMEGSGSMHLTDERNFMAYIVRARICNTSMSQEGH